jgi:glycosyltransferase involved in cell wall biosynthesis
MFRVGRRLPLVVVSPQPWFPLQGIIRRFRPLYRPVTARHEVQDGIDVYFPRFFSFPAILRRLDGFSMALGCFPTLWRLRKSFGFNLLDGHFAYPSGYAATLLGRWFDVPVTVTLRGTEPAQLRRPELRRRVARALAYASRVFGVSDSLRLLAVQIGVPPAKTAVIGNGVDLKKFWPLPRIEARARLGIPGAAKVIISVGGLVERKGFHRVIDLIPRLLGRIPELRYLIVGGPGPEGDMTPKLREQVRLLGLEQQVLFLGVIAPEELHVALSAADLFVLATQNEGWANVFLEAMACGLPVVTTDVGGNQEVISSPALGAVVAFGDQNALETAIEQALSAEWDHQAIIGYAAANSWERRVDTLVNEFLVLADESAAKLARASNA